MTAPGRDHPIGGPGDPLAAEGTLESVWRDHGDLGELPELDTTGWRRVSVLAAHPDDDVLALGGLLARLASADVEILLVTATDGEASHRGNRWVDPAELAAYRVAETRQALARLGLTKIEPVRLRLPDADLAGHAGELTDRLAGLVGADACLAPWRHDRHPDHDAVGRAAADACAATGTRLLEYPVWTWHWARPGDGQVPWPTARRITLTEGERARKNQAISCFGSQLHPQGADPTELPILPPDVVAHFTRPVEVVLT